MSHGHVYSKVELEKMVDQMEEVSKAFYADAMRIGHHAFIEFCGLMREYIQMCRVSLAVDQDFTQTNVHTGGALPIQTHHALYLAEKFECIFGPTFHVHQDKARIFVEAAFPGFTLVPMGVRPRTADPYCGDGEP